jgi:hypothetical protein
VWPRAGPGPRSHRRDGLGCECGCASVHSGDRKAIPSGEDGWEGQEVSGQETGIQVKHWLVCTCESFKGLGGHLRKF